MKFQLSPNLEVDYSTFKEEGLRVTILARSGGGKSNLAALFVEQAIEQGLQTCIIEPIEEWHTLKAVYGDSVVWVGEGGDIPLTPELPHLYTPLLESGANTVFTVATGDEFQDKDFVARLLWSIYLKWRSLRRPLMLVIEEADVYAPQMWGREDRLCLSRVATIAKRGRKLGVNTVFISQRPADIHKTVIAQSNLLFIGGFKTTQDLASIRQLSKLIHLEIPTEDIARLEPGEFYAILRGETHRMTAYLRKTPHGGASPTFAPQLKPELSDAIENLRTKLEAEMEKMREEKNLVAKLTRENEELRRKLQEYERMLETAKVVKEIPLEIKVSQPPSIPTAQPISIEAPEIMDRCPYKGARTVYKYLERVGDYVKLKDIVNNTSIGSGTVRKIVRWMKKKGMVRVKVTHLRGKEYIRQVKLKK